MKKILLLFCLLLAGIQSSCGGCPTREGTQEVSSGVSFEIVVTDENAQSFTEDIGFDGNIPNGTFQLNDFYVFDTRPFPQNQISFQFFFRKNALPNGEDIYDQTAGEVFNFGETPYDGENVKYQESAPQAGEWFPTFYSGTVSITDPTHVQFDLIFSDGNQSREVRALYYFETVTFEQPIGECD